MQLSLNDLKFKFNSNNNNNIQAYVIQYPYLLSIFTTSEAKLFIDTYLFYYILRSWQQSNEGVGILRNVGTIIIL